MDLTRKDAPPETEGSKRESLPDDVIKAMRMRVRDNMLGYRNKMVSKPRESSETHNTDNIRYRRDGSIDTTHYIAEGPKARSRQAHRIAGETVRMIWSPRLGILAVLAALFHLPGGNS